MVIVRPCRCGTITQDVYRSGLGKRFVNDHEYKRFDVEELDCGTVNLLSEVGRKGDEGTMGEMIRRTRRHLFITERGK